MTASLHARSGICARSACVEPPRRALACAAMPSREHHEALWEQRRERRSSPTDFALRARVPARARRGRASACSTSAAARVASPLSSRAPERGWWASTSPRSRCAARASATRARAAPASTARWRLGLDDASFDVVWAGEVIEHVADTAAWLSELRRVLRSGGTLLLSTPAHGACGCCAWRCRAARSRRTSTRSAITCASTTHATLSRLLAEFGFERVAVRRAGGPPGARRAAAARARALALLRLDAPLVARSA